MKLNRKSTIQITKRIGLLLSIFFLFMTACLPSYAQDILAEQATEIVFVLDCSQSMQDVDKEYASMEFIREFTASAPYNCKIGLVAYNNEVAVSLPTGSSYAEIIETLSQLEYRYYGNAGAGMQEAVKLLKNGQACKKIILISDGEIVMKTQEQTEESAESYQEAVSKATKAGAEIDILAIGNRIEDGETIYYAAQDTGGSCYELKDGKELEDFVHEYMFQELKMPGRLAGKVSGTGGELKVKLPDCLMEEIKIILTGKQQNDNLTVNCEAGKIDILKGSHYTVIELQKPRSEEVTIRMASEEEMDVTAYFVAKYEFLPFVSSVYNSDLQQGEIQITIENTDSRNLLNGHLADGGLSILLNGVNSSYELDGGKITVRKEILQSDEVELEILFEDDFSIYSGDRTVTAKIEVPQIEEKRQQIDWFFWIVILIFLVTLIIIFLISHRKKGRSRPVKMIEESRVYHGENGNIGNDFCGKILIYVIHSKEDIDYPPESINLFARCSRDVISLEWLLDECNLPLNLKGAEKIIIRPGEDKSLAVKNNSKAAALKGRELLAKGRFYHLYYHEKITFIFDQEDTEIEIHYKDLKPNER